MLISLVTLYKLNTLISKLNKIISGVLFVPPMKAYVLKIWFLAGGTIESLLDSEEC
jgi:hypothetical protein